MEKINVIRHEILGGLNVNKGITEALINEVIWYANTDSEIKKFTSDFKRFKDRESSRNWLKKGRIIYTLTSGERLLGLIWLGEEIMPSDGQFIRDINEQEYGVTFAIRIYGEARGKHLASKFINIVLNAFVKSADFNKFKKKGIWLEASADNAAAVKVYTRIGFRLVTKADENNKILIVLPFDGLRYRINERI